MIPAMRLSPLLFVFCLLVAGSGVLPSLRAEDAPPSPVVFDRAALLGALTRDLAAHYSVSDELELDLVRPWVSPVSAKAAAQDVTVAVLEYAPAPASDMLVRVRYLQGDTTLREDTLVLQARLWRDVLIAKLPLERGAPVALDTLSTRRSDALRERDALPTSVLGQDFVYTQPLPAGRLLTWRDVVKRALVHRGQLIEVTAVDGALQITMQALAMQDGGRGDTVRVRNLESKREFTGQVTADNRVQVSF